MTATDILLLHDPFTTRLRRRLFRFIVRWRRHRQTARAWVELSRLDEKLRYDLGLDFVDLTELRRRASPASPLRNMAETEALLDLILRRRY
ncbi:MAG: hypothetical protein P0Y65_03715 [Candidatus Devosia phytovorans]|uniref:DUF1127 domain-containing protein n=1 Tax=Candidatus Devosia phytovorans TaxID=3121372 RepID=A0AAJ5VXR3_9HYPH|nr:hypothetical protein [Devosia sp.]WEK05374.1 MAG: hypothetical protein P0Y65_03715 [Devosia sp.]